MTPPTTLTQTAARGLVWFATNSIAARVAQFAAQITLTWLLVPAEIGTVGLALTVTTIAGAAFGLGVSDVLIQRRKSIRLWAAPAHFLSVALGLLGFLAAIASTPLAAWAYGNAGIIPLVALAALAIAIEGFGTVPSTLLRSDLRFKLLAVIGIADVFLAQALTVGLAYAGAGSLSIVLPLPIVAALKVAVLLKAAGHWPRSNGAKRRWRLLVGRSGTVMATRVVIAIVSQADYVLLGILADDAAVGVYYMAFKVAVQPLFALAGGFSGILTPILTRLVHNPERQAEATFAAARLLTFAAMPLLFLQSVVAEPLIRTFLPARWEQTIPIVQILSVGLAFDTVTWAAGAFLSAKGRFATSLRISLCCLPVFVAIVGVGAWTGGATGAAFGVAIYYGVASPGVAAWVFHGFGIHGRKTLVMSYGLAISAGLAMSMALIATNALPEGLARVPAIAFIGGILYLGTVAAWAPAVMEDAWRMARPLMERLKLARTNA